jgi:hypothetical protein
MKKFDDTLRQFLLASRPGDVWDVEIVPSLGGLLEPAVDTPAERWRAHILNVSEIQNRLVVLGKDVWKNHKIGVVFDSVALASSDNATVTYPLERSIAALNMPQTAVLQVVEMAGVGAVKALPTRHNRNLVAQLSFE